MKLWDTLKDLSVGYFATDHWQSYAEFILSEHHRQTKTETLTVEGYNSRIRHYLARFKKNKVLQQVRHDDRNLTKIIDEKVKSETYDKLTMPKSTIGQQYNNIYT